jgi:eukaryotic-like serine/threonine-protein kinase
VRDTGRPLSNLRTLGHYELGVQIGEGGMGQVWKGRDPRLSRTVAIKILKSGFSERFEREARAVSSLNHPHICTLYDIGIEDGVPYLVMEYVEGRPVGGPLPLRDVLRYAGQIASALSAAHHAGVIHRDLKPANVLVGRQGVKLVDFGLAKLQGVQFAASDSDTEPMTRDGILIGTLQYMSPEQLEGREADARSDIFALGLVIYEMLTGRRAFHASSQAGIVGAVLHRDPPPLSTSAPATPLSLERIVKRALEKDPARRWQTMEALKDALDFVAEGQPARTERPSPGWKAWAIGGAAAVTAIVALGAATRYWRPARAMPRLSVDVALPSQLLVAHDSLAAISPDARSFVINASKSLWLRSLEDGSLRALPATTGASLPFWSPDGSELAFFASGKLKKMRVPDGTPIVLCDAPNPRGGAWSRDGTIVFAPRALDGLSKVPSSGGEPTPITRLDASRQEDQHTAPVFLPDGQHFLYHARSLRDEKSTLALGSLDRDPSSPTVPVIPADSGGWFAPGPDGRTGHIVFARGRDLVAMPFDLQSEKVSGEPTVLARRVRLMLDAVANISVSAEGALLYVADEPYVNQPMWVTRNGTQVTALGDLGEYMAVRLTRAETQLATVRVDSTDFVKGIWLLDTERNVDAKLGIDGEADDPVWSPDGQRLAFSWVRPGEEQANVFEVRPGRMGDPRPMVPPGAIRWPVDWSPDGRLVLYAQMDPVTKFDLWAVPADGSAQPFPVLRGPGKENEGRFSPDGAWLAYQTDELRETRVYLTSFPPQDSEQTSISEGGGSEPRWRSDGGELYYVSSDGALYAVPITRDGPRLKPGRPERLFGGRNAAFRVWHFQPSRDGNRFLILTVTPGEIPPIHLLTGWQ